MKSITSRPLSLRLLAALAWLPVVAHAVQDLPGGPSVRQMNLAPPVTRIAQ
ncbi:MAG: cytochrome c oxidase subunit II, partial [Acidovorax sp.]|nr:cytochrome c oxidase subunit II [Acidovorax sp.]